LVHDVQQKCAVECAACKKHPWLAKRGSKKMRASQGQESGASAKAPAVLYSEPRQVGQQFIQSSYNAGDTGLCECGPCMGPAGVQAPAATPPRISGMLMPLLLPAAAVRCSVSQTLGVCGTCT